MSSRVRIAFQTDAPWRAYAELGQLIDRYDFEAATAYEDLFYQPSWPALFQLAEHTGRMRIGPSVVNPYLVHPVLIAANVAMLDAASSGRAYVGIGRGAFFGPIGVPQPQPVQAVREAIEMAQRLLAGDRTPYRGEHFQAEPEAQLRFQTPGRRVPVLVGEWGPRMLAMAGELADDVKVGGCVNPDAAPIFRERIAVGERLAGRLQGTVRLIFGAVTVVDTDGAVAERMARWRAAMYVAVVGGLDPAYEIDPAELTAVQTAMAAGDREGAAAAISEGTLRRYACFGTPDQVVRRLEDLFSAGVDLFEVGAPHGSDPREAIRLIGERVVPAFPA